MKGDPIPYLISSLIAAENDPVIINTVFELIKPADLDKQFQAIYTVLARCWKRYQLIEPVAIYNEIINSYQNETYRTNLLKQFNEIWDLVVSPAFWKHYLIISLSNIKRNKLKELSKEYAGKDLPANAIDDAIIDIKNKVNAIETGYKLNPDRNLESITLDYLSSIDSQVSGTAATKLKTGLYFDKHISGFRAGDYIILAGRPKMGKSAIANTITASLLNNGKRVMLINNEMDEEQVQHRLYSNLFNFSCKTLFNPEHMTEYQLRQLMEFSEDFRKLPLNLYCFAFKTILQIETEAKRLEERGEKPDIIIIDYLQLFMTGEKKPSKYEEVSALSWQIKMLAANLRCPVLALSQLNRKCEERRDKRPEPSDLRESGSLEQDATAVMLIYRDEVYNPNTQEPAILEINVAVNRNGSTGTDKYYVDFDHMKISNLSTRED
jgi:replicative DNA helicase